MDNDRQELGETVTPDRLAGVLHPPQPPDEGPDAAAQSPGKESPLTIEPAWLTELARRRPDFVFMAPYLAYLLLLPLKDWVPAAYVPWATAARGISGLLMFWFLRRHFPPLGKPHWPIAITAGVLTVVLWVGGEHLLNRVYVGSFHLGGRFLAFPGVLEVKDPREGLTALSWASQVVLRLAVATITVPIVEEIFWRGFLLRAFINWDRFERVPLGAFAWRAFIGTALLSCLQHPDNWVVSILCWLAWNLLMYWKKSLLCLMITHGVTNLVLYLYVIQTGDWQFW
ncbi:MAG: CAAX prenyl protease-related protein [Phycisphaerae bacterium]